MNVLETKRLTLRRLTRDDAAFILEILNEPAFIRFVADRGVRTEAQAADYISAKILPSYEEFGFGFYLTALKDSETPIGICGLVKRETLDDVDIGFSFLERFRGKGYAYEASTAVMEYGRTTVGLKRIVAVTAPDNESSMRLLETIGLRFEKMINLPGYGSESRLFS